MDMKLSELKKQIKDNIYEILSEEPMDEGTYVGTDAVDDLQKDPKFAAAKDKTTAINTLKAGGSVTLQEEDEDSEGVDDKETDQDIVKDKIKSFYNHVQSNLPTCRSEEIMFDNLRGDLPKDIWDICYYKGFRMDYFDNEIEVTK